MLDQFHSHVLGNERDDTVCPDQEQEPNHGQENEDPTLCPVLRTLVTGTCVRVAISGLTRPAQDSFVSLGTLMVFEVGVGSLAVDV